MSARRERAGLGVVVAEGRRSGIVAFAGLDMLSGIGALFLEARAVRAPTNIPSLRDSSVEPVSIAVGYRVFLPP